MSRPASSSPFELLLRLPGLVKGALTGKRAKSDRATLAVATQSLKEGSLPLLFCFGCRKIISERPCVECDRETEIFEVTTETDRRLAMSRLAAEGERT